MEWVQNLIKTNFHWLGLIENFITTPIKNNQKKLEVYKYVSITQNPDQQQKKKKSDQKNKIFG